jgi:hypothetical protein
VIHFTLAHCRCRIVEKLDVQKNVNKMVIIVMNCMVNVNVKIKLLERIVKKSMIFSDFLNRH